MSKSSRRGFALLLTGLSAVTGCDRSRTAEDSPAGEGFTIALVADTAADLPACTAELLGDVAYVLEPSSLWKCNAKRKWAPIPCDINNAGDVAYESSSQTLLSCTDERWQVIALPPGPAGEQGPAGQDGQDGADGEDGDGALILVAVEPPGDNCAAGGQKVEIGVDGNGDGALSSAELQQTAYVCNGESASNEGPCELGTLACDGAQPQICTPEGWANVGSACSGATAACTGGACVACETGLVACNGVCKNLETDPDHCGSCDNVCEAPALGGPPICAEGACATCPDEYLLCPTSSGTEECAHSRTDLANCGACGNVCPLGQACINAQCEAVSCAASTDCSVDALCPGWSCANVCPSEACDASYCDAEVGSCRPCFASPFDPLPTGGQSSVLNAQMGYPTYGSPAVYDPVRKRIWLLGGYSYQYGNQTQSMIQYYDVETGESGLAAGSLWSPTINYNTNSAVLINDKIWYATYNQMCYFDLPSSTGGCQSNWYYPSYTYGPAIATDGQFIYVVSNYANTWRFDVQAAVQNQDPWTTLPNQLTSRYDYPGAILFGGWLYTLGGSNETTQVERLDVSDPEAPGQWEYFGSLPTRTYGTTFVRVGQVAYAISGQQEYAYSSEVMAFDLLTGNSSYVGLSLNQGRLYAGAAAIDADLVPGAPPSVYVINGSGYDASSSVGSIEQINLPYGTQPDNDADGLHNLFDSDDDNDGALDVEDSCPFGQR